MHPDKNSNEFFRLQSDVLKTIRKWTGILLLALYILSPIHAQRPPASRYINDNSYFIHLSTQNGLASDKVLNILQDRYGFMWFATENGLSRFDGIHFVNFTHSRKDKNTLSNNVVTALSEDPYGNLWIGTQNGLNRYDNVRNKFYRYDTRNGLKNNFVRALHADKEGNLWIETAQGYLTCYCQKENRWTHFKHTPGVNEGNYYYWQIYEDSLGLLWIGGRTLQGIVFSKKKHIKCFRLLLGRIRA